MSSVSFVMGGLARRVLIRCHLRSQEFTGSTNQVNNRLGNNGSSISHISRTSSFSSLPLLAGLSHELEHNDDGG